jgi:hypothetical protein
MVGIYPDQLISINYVTLEHAHDLGPTDMGWRSMSIERLGMINRCLGVVLIALYLVLACSFIPELLPTSTAAVLLTGSGKR